MDLTTLFENSDGTWPIQGKPEGQKAIFTLEMNMIILKERKATAKEKQNLLVEVRANYTMDLEKR